MKAGMSDALTVNLGERSYLIHFESDVGGRVTEAVESRRRSGRKVAVLTDRNLSTAQESWLRSTFGDAPSLVVDVAGCSVAD